MAKSFYDVLEVNSTARTETIRAAYEVLTRVYTAKTEAGDPDAGNQLKVLKAAFLVLSNPHTRALYDRRLERVVEQPTSNAAAVPTNNPPSASKHFPSRHAEQGNRDSRSAKLWRSLGTGIGVIALVLIGYEAIQDSPQEEMLRELKGQLNDPDSMKTRNVRLVRGPEGKVLCGEVNAKNAFGAYVGFRYFAVTEHPLKPADGRVLVLGPQNSEYMSLEWMKSLVYQHAMQEAGCDVPEIFNIPK